MATTAELIFMVTGDVITEKILNGEIPKVDSITRELISQYSHEPTIIIAAFEHCRTISNDIEQIKWTVVHRLVEDWRVRNLIGAELFERFKGGVVDTETTDLSVDATQEVMFVLTKYMEHATK